MQVKKSTQTRQTLLDAALDIFSVYGLNGASLDEIAQQANLHKSNIFYYYENKEALYIEVLNQVLQNWTIPLQILQADRQPEDAITDYIIKKIESSKNNPKASKLFALEIMQGAPHILPILQGSIKQVFKRKTQVIKYWQEQNLIAKEIDPELFILNIWAITQNYADFATQMDMLTGKTLAKRSMLQRSIKHSVHLLLYGAVPR